MTPLRILILTYEGVIAGSTMSISYLAKGLSAKGHQVTIACKADSLYHRLLKDTEIKIEALPFRSKWDRESMMMIRDIVLRDKIEIINAQASFDRYLSIFARWIYKLPVKLVHTRRQMPLSIGGLQSWFYTKGTDQIIAVSHGVKDALVSKGTPENHITVIYNGTPAEKYNSIDENQVKQLRIKYNIPQSSRVIGCISRLKKHIQLVKALTLIDTPVTAFFLGFTAEQLGLEAVENARKKHSLHFLGMVDPSEVLAYYKIFNVYVLPSTTEGLSQAILEAMYMGLPVVATRAGGNPNIVKEMENGLLFEDGNSEELAQKIEIILSNPTLANTLSEGSKHTAQHTFSIERTIENYISYFTKLRNTK
ncbi:MAG: glycosyltransferase family 4 protein [Bacteroidales bacterium]|jgi:glycosyltransferase involved in cell wall biosynthesis|nr:glycosyltransferase family 4 protein [Bacteroidales bacterium]